MHVEDPAPRRPLTRGEVRAALAFALLFLALVGLEVARDHTTVKLSMVFVLLSWLPMLLIHELGHALCARALGWRVLEMVIGYGPEIARFNLGGTLVVVRVIPIEGHVVPTPSTRDHARLKSALVYAAGPGAELLVIVAIGAVLGFPQLLSRSNDVGVIALQSVAVVGAMSVVMNLVPHAMSGAASDGLGILLSAVLPAEAIEYKLALPYLSEAERDLDRDDPQAAHARVSAGLQRHPDNVPLLIMLARCEVARGDVEGGLARLQELRGREGLAERFEAERLHGAAAAVLESRDPQWLRDAAAAAQAAIERAPGHSDYLLTLGALQLELGQPALAEQTLQAAYRRAKQPLLEDRCLSYLAAAALALGKTEQAQMFARALQARSDSARLLARAQPLAP